MRFGTTTETVLDGEHDAAEHVSGRYVAVLLGTVALLLVLVIGPNLLLGARALGGPDIVRAASDWQQATRGVTYPPPITANRPFKILRLHDRLAEVNGVVLGASSSMGLTADAFPAPIRIYNFAQTGNSLHSTIAEASYIARHMSGQVKWIFVALDWAVGMPYTPGDPPALELSPQAALAAGALAEASFARRLQDAVSWPRVKNLWSLLLGAARSGNKVEALRDAFFATSSSDYRCPDGTPARDFDTINRGICAGFRYDGSATFTDGKRVDPLRGEQLARAAAAPSSKYSRALALTGGVPNATLLGRLAALAGEMARNGVQLVLVMPPLVPGLERELVASRHAGDAVRTTKAAFARWARETGVVVIDASASERFGCTTGEFLDEHHAFPECFRKVFSRYWSERAAGSVQPGLWPPPAS